MAETISSKPSRRRSQRTMLRYVAVIVLGLLAIAAMVGFFVLLNDNRFAAP